ncbi:MAG: hypothetical protein ABW213_11770, partial [Tardiphaga sp.]
MANNPNQVKDPTEVALSAIQEALNISDASASEQSQGSARGDGAPPSMPTGTPAFDNFELRPGATQDRQTTFDAMDPPPLIARRPANDDRETIGQILQAIQQGRPSRSVYTLATLFAAVWIVGCGLLTLGFLPSLQGAIGQNGGVLILAGLATVFF